MIISFAKTTGALLAGQKTVTRRDWSDTQAAKFHAGMLVDAWDRSPRQKNTHGAHKVATIRLTADPVKEWSSQFVARGDDDEYQAEGFVWMEQNGLMVEVADILDDWTDSDREVWVVRFELVEVFE